MVDCMKSGMSQSVRLSIVIAAISIVGISLFLFIGPSMGKSASSASLSSSTAPIQQPIDTPAITLATDKGSEDVKNTNGEGTDPQVHDVTPSYEKVLSSSALECQLEKSADNSSADVTARLVDESTGKGIADRQLLIVVMPGNPIAESMTDNSGEVKVSIDLSGFDGSESMFIFFDGDDKYDFSSCEIHA